MYQLGFWLFLAKGGREVRDIYVKENDKVKHYNRSEQKIKNGKHSHRSWTSIRC